MAGPRAQTNKAHKTRFASKSSRNLHKTSSVGKHRIGKKTSIVRDAKAARIQQSKAKRDQNRAAILKEKRAFSGSASAPRITILFGLSAGVNLDSLEKDLWSILSNGSQSCYPTIASSEYKQRLTVLKAPHGDLLSCIEMAKVADLMCFVASAHSVCSEANSYVDSFGDQCLSMFRSLGLPKTAVLIRDLPSESRKRNEAKKACISSLTSEFPEDCKYFPADTKEELHKFMWLLKEQPLKTPHWRTLRPYLMSEKIDMVADDNSTGKCTLLLTGYLHAHGLSVNQLVHVSGAGDFQLSKIELCTDPCPLNERNSNDLMEADNTNGPETIRSLVLDVMRQAPLLVENVPDPLAGEQTWPTESEMADADQKHKKHKKKILPPGTSDYQAAWIVDESDMEDSENDSETSDGMVLSNDEDDSPGQKGPVNLDLQDDRASLKLRDDDDETDTDSMMMDGENMTREQLQDEIQRIKEAHAEDEEFPDEIDTPLDGPARQRFAKYRALKSFRSSEWDPMESLPQEYARIFAFANFNRTRKHVLAKAEEEENGDDVAAVNSYVRLHIKDVPISLGNKLCLNAKRMPIIVCGLLQHESKMSVLHFSIKKHDSYSDPIKAKEQLIFHVGFRQFLARPIFSSDNIGSDKHKMERFLHPGRFSVASIYAPVSFPNLPLLVIKESEGSGSPAIAAVGSLKSIDTNRIVLKRIILTGYPQRVSKSKCSVRYMFHNPADVRYFQKVELWTKAGRRGRIKEPVGTHGTMKCILNGTLQQSDTVCMSLFKRAYPKWPERMFPLQDA